MSARQPFRPTPRPDSQLSSQQDSLKTFHSQRIDADLDNSANKSFNLSGLFNPKKRDQPLPARKSKSREDHQAALQNVSSNSWSTSSHPAKLDPSRAPSPVLSSTTSGLGNAPTYQSNGIVSTQVEDIPSSPIADSRSPTGSFFAQEANSQHLLPMINEIDEDTELVDAPTARSTSLFFTGQYADSSLPRKRAQRTEDNAEVDNMENISTKRFKPEQQVSGSTSRSRPSSYTHPASPEQFRTKQHGLDVLLGLDSDAHVNENLMKYEDLKKKWANSSMEEWNAGAQEIANKFTEVLDMVKDHMTQNMSLYIDIQTKIDEHKNALEERSKELTEARRDLVKRSGSAIGED